MKSEKGLRRAAGLITAVGVVFFGSGAAAQCFYLADHVIDEIMHYGCEDASA